MRLTDPTQLISAVHGGPWDRMRLATLAEIIIQSADEGDAIAREILTRQVAELADCVTAAVNRLRMSREAVPLALAGGLMVKSASYRQRFIAQLSEATILADPLVVVAEPAEGALRLAAAFVAGTR